jgi:TolB-like protein
VGERLNSWKEIAAYLGREVRTVQRWTKARHLPVHHLPGGDRPRVFAVKAELDEWLNTGGGGGRVDADAIAVLPFQNLAGGEEDRYFGDGLADDVINELVRLPGLRVIARTSSFAFDARGRDVREIGAKLGAGWLLEGSVRRDRKRMRVSAQLVSTHDGVHAWSGRYDRELTDIFAIQDEIARSIALALKINLPSGAAPAAPDLDAYDLWVRGRALSQQYTPEAFAEACTCYEAAIAQDPSFARPYFGLADLLFYGAQFGVAEPREVIPEARAAIQRSLELDQGFGEAHAVLGVFRGLIDYDWTGAEAAFSRALELGPGSAATLIRHSWYHLVPRVRFAEALEEAQQSVALDPLSPMAHSLLGLVLVVARQSHRAVESCRTAVELAPGLWWLHWFFGTALLLDGQVEDALEQFSAVYERVRKPLIVGGMALAAGLGGRRDLAQSLLAELEELALTEAAPASAFAMAYVGLGDDRAFEWFDRAIDDRDAIATHLPSMPLYDSIRGDPRFDALLTKMGLGTHEPSTPS